LHELASASKPHSPFPDDETTLSEHGQRILEGGEVALRQHVDRTPAGTFGTDPAPKPTLIVLGEQVEEDRQLRLVIEVAADDLERVGVEDGEQLLVRQAQQLLQPVRTQNSWFSSRPDGRCRRVPGSSGFAGITAMSDTLAVMPGAGVSGPVC
jgi:hypothetical protein